MKKNRLVVSAIILVLVMAVQPAFTQTYKSEKDSIKLNKKYLELTRDIAELNIKLQTAKNELPEREAKVTAESEEAAKAAEQSRKTASRAEPGDLDDAKAAKRKAEKALDEAEDFKDASDKVKDQNKKIDKLSKRLEKKQRDWRNWRRKWECTLKVLVKWLLKRLFIFGRSTIAAFKKDGRFGVEVAIFNIKTTCYYTSHHIATLQ
jgi:DNA repair ATPase RecN